MQLMGKFGADDNNIIDFTKANAAGVAADAATAKKPAGGSGEKLGEVSKGTKAASPAQLMQRHTQPTKATPAGAA